MIAEQIGVVVNEAVSWRVGEYLAASRVQTIDHPLIGALLGMETVITSGMVQLGMVRLGYSARRDEWARVIGERGWRFGHPAYLLVTAALCEEGAVRYPLAAFGAYAGGDSIPSTRRDALYLGRDTTGLRRLGQVWYDGELHGDWWMLVDISMSAQREPFG